MKLSHLISTVAIAALVSAPAFAQQQPNPQQQRGNAAQQAAKGEGLTRNQKIGLGVGGGLLVAGLAGRGGGGNSGFFFAPGTGTTGTTGAAR